ncbi:hypothetical protein [Pseudomonas faucium]|uniref:hypothetical protein n=1 Tax=Pseudomonas faucium TaxID=2740518 RepID=UPI0039C3A59F
MTDFELNMMSVCFLLVGMLALLVLLLMANHYLDRIEEMLSKSSFVAGNKALYSRAGIIGRLMRVCTISILLSIPQLFVRRGLVDVAQLKEFPVLIRRILVGAFCTACISSVVFLGVGTF